MLIVERLNSFYGRAHILRDLSFKVAAGQVLALIGRNGAGKSTTMKSIIGLVRPASGRIEFGGIDIVRLEVYRVARLGLAYVPEERRIFGEMTVRENLEVGRQSPRAGLRPWTPERVFGVFPNLGPLADRPGARISGGEQQMLTMARSLMGNPRLILLDEPNEGLAPLIVEQVMAAIQTMKAEGVAIVLTGQNPRFATAVADHAVVIEQGQAVWQGSIAELQADAVLPTRYPAI